MYEIRKMDLQLFGEGGDGGAAGDAGEGGGSAAEFHVGDTLPDGTIMDENLASSMRENAEMYRDLFKPAPAQAPQQGQVKNAQQAGTNPDEPTREEWNEAKKRFAKFYGEDVHATVNDRFKNQADAGKQIADLQATITQQQSVLDAIMKKTGVTNFQELQDAVMNEALEAEAEERDIPVEQLRTIKEQEAAMKQLQAENDRFRQAEETEKNRAYVMDLIRQGEELKKIFPDFDIEQELRNNPQFAKATSPLVGMTVEQAYMAFHGKDLQAQSMAYGIEAGRNQTVNAVKANMSRPVEGANRGGRTGGNTAPNMDSMSDDMYDAIREKTMQGVHVTI